MVGVEPEETGSPRTAKAKIQRQQVRLTFDLLAAGSPMVLVESDVPPKYTEVKI